MVTSISPKVGTSAVTAAVPATGSRRGDLFDPLCPTRQLLDRIGGKWVVMIIKVLAESAPEEVRFAALERLVPGISHKMLSQTLQSLCTDSLVIRRVEASVPPKVSYRLTPLGLSLVQPLAALRLWAEENIHACVPADGPK